VLTDFEGEGQILMNKVAAALMRYEDKVFLRVDSVKFSRIRDDISTLISYGDFDRGRNEVAAANFSAVALSAMKNYPVGQQHIRYESPPRPTTAMFGQRTQQQVQYVQSNLEIPGSTSAIGQPGVLQSSPIPTMNGLHRNRDMLLSHQPPPE
jgi:hypothetical protein